MSFSYLDLFLTFARIGVLTFGGGYAMLPIIQREIVEKKRWVSEAEVMDYYAIGQCTPGVIAVNTATFTGRKIGGNLGGVVATAGVVFPSIVIITVIAALIRNFADLRPVQDALAGIRGADPQFCQSQTGSGRARGNPRLRLRSDLQRGPEDVEESRHRSRHPDPVRGDPYRFRLL